MSGVRHGAKSRGEDLTRFREDLNLVAIDRWQALHGRASLPAQQTWTSPSDDAFVPRASLARLEYSPMSLVDVPPLSSTDFGALFNPTPSDEDLLLELLDPHPAPWSEPNSAGELRW